jgi:PAS domain S-box-containing protein
VSGSPVDPHPGSGAPDEAALRTSEARFSGIVAIASDAIISIDRDHRIVLFNQGAEAIFGYDAAEILGQPLDRLLPARARGPHRRHVDAFGNSPVEARRMAERQEISGLRKNGEEFPAEASILKVTVGTERHFTVVLRDVSERMRREASQTFLARTGEVLAGSLELDATLRSLGSLALEHMADFCIIDLVDADNAGVRRVDTRHRDPERDDLARAFAEFRLDRSRPHLMSGVLETGEPVLVREVGAGDLDRVAQDAVHRELLEALDPRSWIVVPLQARGRILGALLCMRCGPGTPLPGEPFRHLPYDRDDLELARELGLRAGLAVDHAHLFRQARQAVEARDEVVAVVSHDLGNPLQAIFIGLEAMERSRAGRAEGRPGQEEYYLTAIRRSAEVMERLIQDLLEVRRMEAGRLELDPVPTALGPLVDEALEMLLPLARVKEITVRNDVPTEGLPTVRADGDRIQQVLSNLVGNAVKHTPEEGVVRLWCEVDDQEFRLHVTDSGQGIPADDLSRVFDRFWRAGRGRGPGIGLGLAIARGIVRGHGGRIWVESEEGSGSTFSFALPLEGSAQRPAAEAGAAGNPEIEAFAARGPGGAGDAPEPAA